MINKRQDRDWDAAGPRIQHPTGPIIGGGARCSGVRKCSLRAAARHSIEYYLRGESSTAAHHGQKRNVSLRVRRSLPMLIVMAGPTHSEASIACFSTRLASRRVFTQFTSWQAEITRPPRRDQATRTQKKKNQPCTATRSSPLTIVHANHTCTPGLGTKLPREMGPDISHSGNWRLTRVLTGYPLSLRIVSTSRCSFILRGDPPDLRE